MGELESRLGKLLDEELQRLGEVTEADVDAIVERLLAHPNFADAVEHAAAGGEDSLGADGPRKTVVWTFDSDDDSGSERDASGGGHDQWRESSSGSGSGSGADTGRGLFSAGGEPWGDGGKDDFDVVGIGHDLLAEGLPAQEASAVRAAALKKLDSLDASEVLADSNWSAVRDGLSAALADPASDVSASAEQTLTKYFEAALPGAFASEVALALIHHLDSLVAGASPPQISGDASLLPHAQMGARVRLLAHMMPEVARSWVDLSEEQSSTFCSSLCSLLSRNIPLHSAAKTASSLPALSLPRPLSPLLLFAIADPSARWLHPVAARAAPLAALRQAATITSLSPALLALARCAAVLLDKEPEGTGEGMLALARLEAAQGVSLLGALLRGDEHRGDEGGAVPGDLGEVAEVLSEAIARAVAAATPGAPLTGPWLCLLLACARTLTAILASALCRLSWSSVDGHAASSRAVAAGVAGARRLLEWTTAGGGGPEAAHAGAGLLQTVLPPRPLPLAERKCEPAAAGKGSKRVPDSKDSSCRCSLTLPVCVLSADAHECVADRWCRHRADSF